VFNTPTSYSGVPGFDSRPRRTATLIEFFVVFLSTSMQISEYYHKIRPIHDHSVLYSLVTEEASLNKVPTVGLDLLALLSFHAYITYHL
jgi:hypothetical protein